MRDLELSAPLNDLLKLTKSPVKTVMLNPVPFVPVKTGMA
jgi:hypothetical protein